MNSLAHPSLLRNFFVVASIAVALLVASSPQRSNGQSLVVDFQFDASSGGGTSQNVTNTGQVFTVDVYATVTGTVNTPTQADLQQLGIQLCRFAARSSQTGGGAFAVGPASTTGANALVGVTLGGASTIKDPFNNPGSIGPQGDFNNDGINDLGGASRTVISIAQNSASTQFGGGSLGNQVGTTDSWRWLLETFTITAGNPAGKSGTTTFTPTVVGTGASTWTTDGATTADNITTWKVGSAVSLQAVQAPGTTIGVASDVAAASVLKGGSIGLGATITNTGSLALAAGGYNFTASGGAAIGYNPANANTAALAASPGPGNSSHQVFTASTTPGPAGTPIGIATVTFTGSDNGSGTITNSPQTATTQLNVGGAIADNTNVAGVYGPPISAVVGPTGSYAGLESAVVGLQGAGGSNAAVVPFGPPFLGGDAKILAGSSSSMTARTVSMQWRTRLVGSPTGGQLDETHGGPGSALLQVQTTTGLVSDVVNLTGLVTGSPLPSSADPFVLDMTYNPALLPKHGAVEAGLAKNKLIFMVSPSPGPDNGVSQYVNTVALNTGNVVVSPLDNRYGYQGSYAQFQADVLGGNGGTPASELGAWGSDIATHEVWAVVNHDSTFAVVPEPAAILLAGLGLLGLFGLRRVKKA
jgi:hypothetical protein